MHATPAFEALARRARAAAPGTRSPDHEPAPASPSAAGRPATACSCGGGCPRCQAGLQRKASVSMPGDAAEREADAVADRVLRMAEAPAIGAAPLAIQRKCAACEEDDDKKLQRKESTVPGGLDTGGALRAAARGGALLGREARAFFEPRFGRDLGGVRIHDDAGSANAARGVQARAYTVGSHIVFGAGEYAPGTPGGRALLAHELAHVMQQGAAQATIHRSTDYDIRGVDPTAAGSPGSIFFDFGSATPTPAERAKIPALALPAGRALTLFGYASEEGSAASRTALTGRRLASVDAALAAAGHTGTRTLQPDITRGEGNADYRSMRVVSVEPTASSGPTVSPQGSGACTPTEPCGTSFTTALPVAAGQLGTTIGKIIAGTPDAVSQMATLFPGVPKNQILTGLNGLVAELAHMTTHFQCHNGCDQQCDRPGYSDPVTRVMTLCPDFLSGASVPENALLLLHEGLHMVPGLTTVDTAYRLSRYMDFLSGAQASTNTDSFVLLIVRLSGSTAAAPPVDPMATLAAPDQNAARRSLAYVEQWLLTCDWDSSVLYNAIKADKGRVGGWDPANAYSAGMQHAIGWIFGLTDPGPAAPFATPPTQLDQEKVAGIHDRYNRFMRTVWTRPIAVTSSASGPEAWAANLGASVVLTPAFFALSASDQVLRLIELMAASLPASDVPVARQRDYANAAQQTWWHAGRSGP